MEWSDVRIFLAVVRSGTLGGAARSLRISHPTVGRRLRALEEATGQTLFQRTADGFVLTEEGSAITLAEQMEEGALAMERRLAGQEQNLHGSLRISSAEWFGAYVLPPIIAEYTKAYPGVDVEILTGTRLFSLAQRESDIAFRIVPFDTSDIIPRACAPARYSARLATSSAVPYRLIAIGWSMPAAREPGAGFMSVSVGPGWTTLTVMSRGAQVTCQTARHALHRRLGQHVRRKAGEGHAVGSVGPDGDAPTLGHTECPQWGHAAVSSRHLG